jgi:AraC-like DNA-binding protein
MPDPQTSRRSASGEPSRSESAEPATQRVGPLVVIPLLLQEMGVHPAEVLSAAGLSAAALSAVENRIPYVSMGKLLHQCAATTGCPHFGLLAGQRMRLSHLGLPGKLVRYSETLGAAIRTFVVYHHLNSGGMATFMLEQDGIVTLGSAIYHKGVEFTDHIYDGVIAMTCSVMRELCGARWAPEKVLFSRARPADVGAYRRFFQAPCRFDSEQTAMLFPAHLLARPMAEADRKRFRNLEEQAQAVGIELVAQLRRALRILLLGGRSSGDEVAQILSMHRRTLNRRLRAQGITFQQILDEVRFEAARQLLDTTNLALTDIAVSLGYTESGAFSRAFRRWSGTAPSSRRSREQTEPN